MLKDYMYNGKETFHIRKVSTNETSHCLSKEDAEKKMAENEKKLDTLQQKLYADKKEGLIVVFSWKRWYHRSCFAMPFSTWCV